MKSIFTPLIFCLSLLFLNGQNLEKSNLWKIDGNGISKPSYLFGTMHITCDASLNEKTLSALDETDQLILELDMDDPQLQAEMMNGMLMKDGIKISNLLNEEDYEILDKFLVQELGVSLSLMNQMKPFFIQASLYPILIDCPMESYESELMRISQEQNEEILGLETVQDQLKVFDDIPYEDQLKDLLKMAKDNMEYDRKMMKKMIALYNSEDIDAMLNMMNDENYTSIAEHQDLLLSNRNKNWIQKIELHVKSKPTFFGVGAGHLGGEQGVIQLLRSEGYEVTPVH